MKACLQCNKQYQEKRDTSKFCSDKCRVKYNRKHPKNSVTKIQMQALFNAVMEKLAEVPNSTLRAEIKELTKTDDPLSFDKMRAEMTPKSRYDVLLAELHEAKDLEQLEAIGRKITASDLHWKEKQSLKNIGIQIARTKFPE